jgi:molybdopterin-guanine dinucleotide biosynthesis protein A
MGHDKATLVVEGETLAVRLGRLLAGVAWPSIEVGPGHSGLEAVREAPRFSGPLGALVAGWRALRAKGHTGPVLVLACDLPILEAAFLERLAGVRAEGSVVPVVEGRRQLLAARWSAHDLAAARDAFERGERALAGVPLGPDLVELSPEDLGPGISAYALCDCDTPEDLVRLGLGCVVEAIGHE